MLSEEARASILVVEDENVVAMDLVSSLEKLQYAVTGVAATGEEAIELARTKSPALVLMDIHLRGGMDGILAAQKIQHELFIPIVYLTAYSDEATLQRARVTHPFGYVLKPFEDRDIDVAIQIALFRHKMDGALRASEQRLQAILGSIGDAVIATDIDRRITFLNRSAEALTGWKSERAQGRLLADVLRLSAPGSGPRMITRGKETVPVEVVESPVLDSSGRPSGYVTVARDLSERLRAQEAHERELIERGARAAAEKDRERARLKSDVSLVLADFTQVVDLPTALRRLANLLVPVLGDCCVLVVEDGPEPLWIAAHADAARAARAEELLRAAAADGDAARGLSAVVRTGEPELFVTIPESALVELAGAVPPPPAVPEREGLRPYLCVPLRARQRILGALAVITADPNRGYGWSDVAFVQELAERAAIAIDNARLYRQTQEAQARAERLYLGEQEARAEAETLFRIADALTETHLDLEALVQRVTDEATAAVGAHFGALFYNATDEEEERYVLGALSGASLEVYEQLGMPRNTPLFGPTFTGRGIVRLSDVRTDPRHGQRLPHHGVPPGHLPIVSYLAVPVVSRTGAVIGGIFLGHPDVGQFTEQHERIARALAAHAAVGIDNARLFVATREAEQLQGRLVRDLERTVRFSEMFVGILGHDLRNPLSAISTAASLVLSRADSERIIRPIGRILHSAERMGRMIDQILDFTHARIGRGIPIKRKRTHLGDVCRQVLDELRTEAEDEAEVRLELRGDTVGEWDEDRLCQLLSNLVGNAFQHRARGTPVTVLIDGSQDDRVVVEVTNEGVVPAEIVPVIFEPFRGTADKQHRGSSGLGLGVYISQQIVLAHGGTIRLETDPASGTRFIVELPRVPQQAAQVFGTGVVAK